MDAGGKYTFWIPLLLFTIFGQTLMDQNKDLRIILVGKTGAGKSATGNTILGREDFQENNSFESVTKQCRKQSATVGGTRIDVIDTPGLFDTEMKDEEVQMKLEECIGMSAPGPHAFLLVIRLDARITKEEIDTVKWIENNFGEEASLYTLVLFTHGDLLQESIEGFLENTKDKFVKRVINNCGGRYHVFNNKEKNERLQVSELMGMIEGMVNYNGGQHYTNEMYQEAQRKIEEEEKRRKQEEERERKEVEDRIREEESSMFWCKVKAFSSIGAMGAAAYFSSPLWLALGAGLGLSGYNCTLPSL